MTRDFISVSPEESILDCSKIMIKKRVGSLVLQEKNILRGLITERDIIWALTKKSGKEFGKIKAKDLARKKVVTIRASADIGEALQKMRKSKYRWLPVVNRKQVVGFLTLKDILRIEPSLFEIGKDIFQIKEEDEKIRRKSSPVAVTEGICEECGNFGPLYKIDGRLICESCKDEM